MFFKLSIVVPRLFEIECNYFRKLTTELNPGITGISEYQYTGITAIPESP